MSADKKTIDPVCSIQTVFRASRLTDDHSKPVGYRSYEIQPLLIQNSAQKQPRTLLRIFIWANIRIFQPHDTTMGKIILAALDGNA